MGLRRLCISIGLKYKYEIETSNRLQTEEYNVKLKELTLFQERTLNKNPKITEVNAEVSIPPKYAVAQVIGFIKGKSAIAVARNFGGRTKNFTRQHFWARGYHVSTVGRDEDAMRRYIRKHEEVAKRHDQQMNLFE